jgi:ribonuclease HI
MPSYSSTRAGRASKELFATQRPKTPEQYLIAYTDGGARGNPGPAGYGVVINDQSGKKVAGLSRYLGHQTNNVAEYEGLIAALTYAREHGHKALKVISDSELLVRQVKGVYKVKNLALQKLHSQAKELVAQLDWFSVEHVLRGHNQEADRLANEAMDKGMGRAPASVPIPAVRQEFNGVVRGGVVELVDGVLPDGTRVQVRIKS